MKEIFNNKKVLLSLVVLLMFSVLSAAMDYHNISDKNFDKVCKYPSSKFTALNGKDYNYCIGPLYYMRYHNSDQDVTIIPIDATDEIKMGIWFLPGITIYEK